MAEEETTAEEQDALDEVAEETLEEIPPEGEEAGEGEEKTEGGIAKLRKLIQTRKKLLIVVGILLLVLLIGGGVALYLYLSKSAEELSAPIQTGPIEEVIIEPEPEEKGEIKKVHVYELVPFFLPLKVKGSNVERFITITPSLVLSHEKVAQELEKNLPLLRGNLYNIFRRKKPEDLIEGSFEIKKKIKQEIITQANSVLLSDIGTVTNVLLVEYVVK